MVQDKLEPSERDRELAREAHCRYCAHLGPEWPTGSPAYDKCRNDVEDTAESFATARAEGRAEVVAKVREWLREVHPDTPNPVDLLALLGELEKEEKS